MSGKPEFTSDHGRRAPRFSAPDEIVLVLDMVRIPLADVSDSGMSVLVPEGTLFTPETTYDFRLIVRDAGKVTGWHLAATCAWFRDDRAGFRFVADSGFSRDLYAVLSRLLAAGRVQVVNGTEI